MEEMGMLSTSENIFAGFGPSKYLQRSSISNIELPSDYAEVRAQVRNSLPEAPGVYGMIDDGDRLIYVGMSRCLRKRVLTYFQEKGSRQPANWQSNLRHRKESRVAVRAKQLVWESTDHELLALLREHELIRRFGPEMNIRGRRRRRLVYFYLSVEVAPKFKFAAVLPKGCRTFWGPVPNSSLLLRGIDALNWHFRLPDCKPDVGMRFNDEPDLFDLERHPQCLRGQLERCVAPCAGMIAKADYFAQIKRACAFLNGHDDAPLDLIAAELKQAIDARRFEQAASLHDSRTALIELRECLRQKPEALPASFVYSFMRKERRCWLAAHEGRVVKVGLQPCNTRHATVWKDRLDYWRTAATRLVDEREGSELQILSSWFRRFPSELEKVQDFDAAQIACGRVSKTA